MRHPSRADQLEEVVKIRRVQQAAAEQDVLRARRHASRLETEVSEVQSLLADDQESWSATMRTGGIDLGQAASWSRQILLRTRTLAGLTEEHRLAIQKLSALKSAWDASRAREQAVESAARSARKFEQRKRDERRLGLVEDQSLNRMRSSCG